MALSVKKKNPAQISLKPALFSSHTDRLGKVLFVLSFASRLKMVLLRKDFSMSSCHNESQIGEMYFYCSRISELCISCVSSSEDRLLPLSLWMLATVMLPLAIR